VRFGRRGGEKEALILTLFLILILLCGTFAGAEDPPPGE
jgi:hypothetical protein